MKIKLTPVEEYLLQKSDLPDIRRRRIWDWLHRLLGILVTFILIVAIVADPGDLEWPSNIWLRLALVFPISWMLGQGAKAMRRNRYYESLVAKLKEELGPNTRLNPISGSSPEKD